MGSLFLERERRSLKTRNELAVFSDSSTRKPKPRKRYDVSDVRSSITRYGVVLVY